MENGCYENRELSWLRFNERVLEEAEDNRVPLCERLSFLSIFQTNLDEFFMVRIGSLHDQMLLDKNQRDNKTKMTAEEQIDASLAAVHTLCHRRDIAYAAVLKELNAQGVNLLWFKDMEKSDIDYLEQKFEEDFLPLLSPFIIGKKQSFPFLKNHCIYAVAVMVNKNDKRKIGIIDCGDNLFPRLIPLPGHKGSFILSEELILHYMPKLFPGYRVRSKTLARITRNADIDADRIYDEDLDYRDHMAEVLKMRPKLSPVRLELSRAIDVEVISKLCKKLELISNCVFEYDAPLDFSFVGQIRDELRSKTELFYPPRFPQHSSVINSQQPMIPQIQAHDIMLHYPYQSIAPFLRLLNEAAVDPRVKSIKMTLYRVAHNSEIVGSLVRAAENGKQVDVLVELKARFDEARNIDSSRQLELAGCHVIYGLENIKVHSKICLITLRDETGISYITQVGTGNYNEQTCRFYTDLSVMTADKSIGREVSAIFKALGLGETVEQTNRLLVAPNCLQNKLMDAIDGEIAKAREGNNGQIRIKINSLSDKILMDKLIEASCAGVKIDMIVRGICCLKAGVPGLTENIRIISIVGRYLEHSRIYIFGAGETADIYISSADWMTRNTLRRVEVALPVLDNSLKQRLENIFAVMWQDNVQARVQEPSGRYVRRTPGENRPWSAQEELFKEAERLSASEEDPV